MKLPMTVLLASLAFNTFAATPPNHQDTTDIARRLQAAETKWQETRPDAYTYTLQRGCFCMPEITKPMEISVNQDTISNVNVLPEGTPLADEFKNFALTVDSLFQTIHEAIDQKAATLDVKYDQVYGFPTHIYIDRDKMMADEELSLDASDFTPEPADDSNMRMCTQEVRACPDGSYVGRTGPNCEFAACPDGSLPQ